MLMVNETHCGHAARRIMVRLKVNGGAWVVMACDADGFAMEPAGSDYAQRMLRSGSPSIAGVFTRDADLQHLTSELVHARQAEHAPRRRVMTAADRAWATKYRRKWRMERRARGLQAS